MIINYRNELASERISVPLATHSQEDEQPWQRPDNEHYRREIRAGAEP